MNNRVKLIDQNKVDAYIEQRQRSGDGSEELWMLQEEMKAGKFDPDTPPVPTIKPGDKVRHKKRGVGIVIDSYGSKTVADFDDGLFELLNRDLEVVE